MSGGAMDYLYEKVQDQVGRMGDPELDQLLGDVAGLLHDREWYLSGDYTADTYWSTVNGFKKKWFDAEARTTRLRAIVKKECAELQAYLLRTIGAPKAPDDKP